MKHYRGWLTVLIGMGTVLVQAQVTFALSKADISKTAENITVMIQDIQDPKQFGSGVIIRREGQRYTVLTARHVVEAASSFKVKTLDEQQHPVVQGSIQSLPGVDLALIQFTSVAAYRVATVGDSAKSPSGTASFVAGFPEITAVRTEPSFYFTSGEIAANANRPLKDGYALVYTNPTLPGMSGGPVLNEQAELIGIHGRGEMAVVPQNAQIRPDIYVLKTAFNFAIPINTFLRLAAQTQNPLVASVQTPLSSNITAPSISTSLPENNTAPVVSPPQAQSAPKLPTPAISAESITVKPPIAEPVLPRTPPTLPAPEPPGAVAPPAPTPPPDKTPAIASVPSLPPPQTEKSSVAAVVPSTPAPVAPTADDYFIQAARSFNLNDFKRAVADFDEALRLKPSYVEAYVFRGVARSFLGDQQGAIADYDQALRLRPNYAYAYHNRGVARSNLGDKQGAIADYDQALRLNPGFAEAYYNRAVARSIAGDKQGAITDYDQALRMNPKDAAAYQNRGAARFAAGDKQGAISDYDIALRMNPNDADTYHNRGRARAATGDPQGAIADYDQSLRLNPNDAYVYNNRGLARFAVGDKSGAIADYDQALRLNPNYAYAYNNRGVARFDVGDKPGAIADLEKAASLYKAEGNQTYYESVMEWLKKVATP